MHKLDETIKHYGVKGMKWNIRRDPEQIKEDLQNGVNAAGEALEDAGDEVLGNDSIMEELGDVVDVFFGGKGNLKKETRQLNDAIKDKLEDVNKDLKKRGQRMMERMFGPVEPKKSTTRALVMTKDGYVWKDITKKEKPKPKKRTAAFID